MDVACVCLCIFYTHRPYISRPNCKFRVLYIAMDINTVYMQCYYTEPPIKITFEYM